jgi:outer membrane protein OmpA-like peptidoglycan-associated protein
MKRFILLVTSLLLLCGIASGQSILRNLGERAKQAVENKVGEKVENAVNNALGNNSKNDKKSDDKAESADTEEAVTDEPVDFAEVQAKSDFVRGSNVFFSDDLNGEKMGEFPSKWDLLEGSSVEVVNILGTKAMRLEGSRIQPLMEEKEYLPEEFTIEFDVLAQPAQEGSGWDATLDLIMEGADRRVFDIRMSPEYHPYYGNEYNGISWGWGAENPNGNKMDGAPGTQVIKKYLKKNDWNHIAISFNKRAFKMYLNYQRIVNIPNMIQPRYWWIDGSSDSDKGIFIRNIVMAKGAVELYERNATDYSSAVEKAIAETGKFVTNNILFETGKATLKPESMEEIMKVAEYMKKNPSARFEVQGHTDNQGSDAVNDPLSQQRAEAVVKALEEQGVDPFNLRAVGKGSHEPVAENTTDEGRAKNRRVEFIKK